MPAGAYAKRRAWQSAQTWLADLTAAVHSPAGEAIRAKWKVSTGTLDILARFEISTADFSTGRGVATAHQTVADALGMSKKTVQRGRSLIEELGFAATVVRGRYLTRAERKDARGMHGGVQLRAASVRVLTSPIPSTPSVENVHLPVSRREIRSVSVLKSPPTRASARARAASRPSKEKTKTRKLGVERPRALATQRLAAQLAVAMPWLGRGGHIGTLCEVLQRRGIDGNRYTATSLIAALDVGLSERRLEPAASPLQKRPLAYFAWMLDHFLPIEAETRVERQRREHDEAAQRRARAAEERVAEAAFRQSLDHESIDFIIEASNAEIRARSRRRVDRTPYLPPLVAAPL